MTRPWPSENHSKTMFVIELEKHSLKLTNIPRENGPLEREIPIGKHHF